MDADTTKAIQDAVNGAVTTAIKNTVTTAVNDAVQEGFKEDKKKKEEDEKKKFDPFRNAILFLAGLLAFCLSIIVGIFGTMSDFEKSQDDVLAGWLLGGVLAWISLAALAATVSMLILQVWKAVYFYRLNKGDHDWIGRVIQTLLMLGPLLLGAGAVYYYVRVGAVMMKVASITNDKLPSFMTALCSLF